MSTTKSIRQRLQLTQAALAEKLGCSQGNVWQYERKAEPNKPAQTVPPEVAKRLVAIAKEHGLVITLDQVYGLEPLPFDEAANDETKAAA